MGNTNTTARRILYVDDDSDDWLMLQESFARQARASTEMICAEGGEEAIQYLSQQDKDGLPSLIILDLNMPRWDGRRTLSYIKDQPQFAGIPVVILSTSTNKKDKELCVSMGAASYFEKPFHLEGYREIVNNCLQFIEG